MNDARHTTSSTSNAQPPRLVLYADCTTCGRLNGDEDNPLTVVDIALDHTDGTGHVVVLNGTTDIPDEERIPASEISAGESGLPPIPVILADPAASSWLKNALQDALSRDPVDAANDAEIVAKLLDRRCREILNALTRVPSASIDLGERNVH
jgi:hypothetical protein